MQQATLAKRIAPPLPQTVAQSITAIHLHISAKIQAEKNDILGILAASA